MAVGSWNLSIDVLIPVTLVLLGLAVVTAMFVGIRRKRRARAFAEALLRSGQPAPATIISARDGSLSGNHPYYRKDVRLVLEVRPRNQNAFQANATMFEALGGDVVQPGQVLLVRYDPGDPSTVAVDPDSFKSIVADVLIKRVEENEAREKAAMDLLKRS